MTDDERLVADGDAPVHPAATVDAVRLALVSYQLLFERAAAAAQLADDERLHRMLDALALFGVVSDVDGDVTYMNIAMRERLGCELDDVVGRGLDDASRHDSFATLVVRAINAEQLAPEWFSDVPLSDGSTIAVRWTSTFIRDNHGNVRGLTSVGEDLSGADPTDEEKEASRMESVGRLAGGIAHDFNNFLAVIGGHTHLARSAPGLSSDVEPHLDQIDVATQRATELIRQLLAFGRRDVSAPAAISMSEQVSDVVALMRPTFRDTIVIEVVTATNDDLVHFNSSQLDQIFVNLAFNSRDAMPDGGTITLSITDQVLDQERAVTLGVEPGGYVVVTATDDGVGIDPGLIGHVFERHVTSKPFGRGSGLGLSTVLDVITQAGGAITVDAERVTGTEFTLYFRRAPDHP